MVVAKVGNIQSDVWLSTPQFTFLWVTHSFFFAAITFCVCFHYINNNTVCFASRKKGGR